MRPKILVMAASLRAGSHNARLAALAVKELTLAEADVTRVSLADYPLPIFDADLMAGSGLPLVTKPIRERWRLVRDAFDLMVPGAPFVQFTYSVASPLPKRLGGFTAEASERIWMNLPPARVWVYRKR